MEGLPKEERVKATIHDNDNEGTYVVEGLEADMIAEVEIMRAEDIEIASSLMLIEQPKVGPEVKELLQRFLKRHKPDFNWELYFSFKQPTIH